MHAIEYSRQVFEECGAFSLFVFACSGVRRLLHPFAFVPCSRFQRTITKHQIFGKWLIPLPPQTILDLWYQYMDGIDDNRFRVETARFSFFLFLFTNVTLQSMCYENNQKFLKGYSVGMSDCCCCWFIWQWLHPAYNVHIISELKRIYSIWSVALCVSCLLIRYYWFHLFIVSVAHSIRRIW